MTRSIGAKCFRTLIWGTVRRNTLLLFGIVVDFIPYKYTKSEEKGQAFILRGRPRFLGALPEASRADSADAS